MNAGEKTVRMDDMKVKLSTLWVVVMFNIISADILSFMIPGALQEIMTGFAGSIRLSQGFMLVAAIFLEIPIAMIFLSRFLKYGANRWANIIAGVVTIAYVVVGASPTLHYVFFATIEVACMLLIVWSALKWPNPEVGVKQK